MVDRAKIQRLVALFKYGNINKKIVMVDDARTQRSAVALKFGKISKNNTHSLQTENSRQPAEVFAW